MTSKHHNLYKLRANNSCASGQAIIEFALIVSVVLLLLAAAVNLGNAYRTYQTLANASAEAGSYLSHNPIVNCKTKNCPGGSEIAGAEREARIRFRNEQGPLVRGVASTLDLDNNGVDDIVEHGWAFVEGRVRFQVADSSQISINNPHSIPVSFGGTSDLSCQQRQRFDTGGGPCFIVVQAKAIYRPMILSTVLGREMSITAIAIKPIVEGD
ncbi:MAG: hypothetical protein AVDCRST_MAG93-3286 [uncultured Chloroflexia bacterium]|uniref:TadE-like domain-containing protein n=1 Tax=uncultured Chloroflexia bacterium TaxID=1672391 RepID=A0A6J4JMH7_9CHLR|nr:MAG: hypothetical protein AVDCRST_MAG93-3286 [uncultured Chloroflexia bacterium]